MNDVQALLTDINENLLEILKLLGTHNYSYANTPVKDDNTVDKKIAHIFITIGIPANLSGYKYFREAIKLTMDEPNIINNITTRLYPKIAQMFDTSPSKVERAMRHAIDTSYNRGKMENINSLFGVRVYNSREKPTNSEFIALIADNLMLETI